MDSLPNELLHRILAALSVTDKFRVMRVSKKWMTVCRLQVEKQQRLALGTLPSESFVRQAVDFTAKDLVSESVASVRHKTCWSSLFRCMPSLTGVYAECEAGLFIRALLQSCSETITCILCPNWTFAWDWSLPQLTVLAIDFISAPSLHTLIIRAPELTHLRFSRTDFRYWDVLPHGLRSLTGGELPDRPFDRLFSSPAAATLVTLSLRSEMLLLSRSYVLPALQELEVSGNETLNDTFLLNWSETLRSSRGLQCLHLSSPVQQQHLTSAILWNSFFSAIPNIRTIYLNLRCHLIGSLSHMVSSLVSHCTRLQELTLPYSHLSDHDLEVISRLNQLKKFLLYSNCGPVTERGISALLHGECCQTLTELHIYANYKQQNFSPSMCTAGTRQRIYDLRDEHKLTSATLQYVNFFWQM